MSVLVARRVLARSAFLETLLRQSLILLTCLTMLGVASAPSMAAPKFSALTIDARNGKVLYASDPDGIRHPASLTKMMTLYILFQDLKAGKIKLNTPIRMSARAASMAPTKLGVKAGRTFPVEIAIKALVVKSANDVAAAVAENLGGTESAFAARMTRTARALGMSRTTFKNASGLPNPAQVTTARDMATLGLRLMRDFPQYYPYFRTTSFSYGGKTISTHNRLLKNYEGTDGIKTGYINASGFNLVSSVRRGDKRLVGVVIGGKSGNSRNAYMQKMLTKAFPKASGGKTIAALAGSSKGAIAPVEDTAVAANEKKKKKGSIAALLAKKEVAEVEPTPVAEAEPVQSTEGSGDVDEADVTGTTIKSVAVEPPSQQTEVIEGNVGGSELPANLPFQVKKEATASPETVASLPDASWNIQIGEYSTKRDAQAQMQAMMARVPKTLANKQAFTMTVQKGEEVTYRAVFSGFTEASAKSACKTIVKQKSQCYILPPSS